jgi:thiamine-phosphate pyrophosphorylase
MTICLVTDRRRADPLAQARAAAASGVDLIQVRERDLDASALAMLVRALVGAVRGVRTERRPDTPTRVVVNDRLDVALACGADGVHLRADSMPAAAARRIAPPGFLVGRSVHSAREAATAGDVDYLVAGTVFSTSSKPDCTAPLGEDGLRRIVAAARAPVLAIGGVTVDACEAIARAGAAGIAAIGLFGVPEALDALVRTLRSRFDSAKTAP